MIEIVHFGKYYLPDVGGIEAVTSSLAQGVIGVGYTSTVICFNKAARADMETINGVRVLRAPISMIIASQPLSLRYVQLSLREARRADIVHVHAPNMLAAL